MDTFNIPYHLNIDLKRFGFVNREKDSKNNTIKNRCGRDFLYYVLNHIEPEKFNPNNLNPVMIENQNVFGLKMPSSFIWTGLSFKNIPRLLSEKGYKMKINDVDIKSYLNIIYSLFFKAPKKFDLAMSDVKKNIETGNIVGVDISVGLKGLIDHVMFVYGFDDDNLYVFDTHRAYSIDYTKITSGTDSRFIMKLPFSVIKNSWTRFSRIWIISKKS